ncbi:MAG: hypothetical protein MI784_12750 [Cytophagales bacterium]|nr:hypothetical protein [Cytophagales bacterium]
MSGSITDYPGFTTPINELLDKKDFDVLTDEAKNLLAGDLIALAWKHNTVRTEKLRVRDLQSIEEAFSNHSFFGNSRSPVVGIACCCCTCTPACCCTAASVIKAV